MKTLTILLLAMMPALGVTAEDRYQLEVCTRLIKGDPKIGLEASYMGTYKWISSNSKYRSNRRKTTIRRTFNKPCPVTIAVKK